MEEQRPSQTEAENAEQAKTPKKKTEKKMRALTEELEDVRAELADKTDKFLRLAADYDNFRKRKIREFDELVANASEKLIRELIPIADDVERALASAGQAENMDAFHQGIEMIRKQLLDVLARQGVRPIETVDRPFDPHIHEAVMVVEKEGIPPDHIVEEVQRGYSLNDRVLRPAKVVVSR